MKNPTKIQNSKNEKKILELQEVKKAKKRGESENTKNLHFPLCPAVPPPHTHDLEHETCQVPLRPPPPFSHKKTRGEVSRGVQKNSFEKSAKNYLTASRPWDKFPGGTVGGGAWYIVLESSPQKEVGRGVETPPGMLTARAVLIYPWAH